MPIHELAGKSAPPDILVDLNALERAYYEIKPDVAHPDQQVAFGTSGHRGCSLDASFNEAHILAITQAVCDYRKKQSYTGPLYLGKDTHFLSDAAQKTALQVLAANGVHVVYQQNDGYTPTPVISRAILTWNAKNETQADGIVITPSHNPPRDGGIKYNPPNGGPADTDVTGWIQNRANELLAGQGAAASDSAPQGDATDFATDYIADLENVIDMKTIADAKIRIGVDPLGGAAVAYWEQIAEKYGLDITVVNKSVDPTFSFMRVDHDGKIRMDCSSPYAMRGLVDMLAAEPSSADRQNQFDIAFANDADTDRHGIVVPSVGLMNPNHYLAVAIQYLFTHRDWKGKGVGKTLVSSGVIDKVAADLGLKLVEVPVGFKWFVEGLFGGTLGFGGEESAGASFLRKDGTVWTTDKDGIILNLLAAEILATEKLKGSGKDPGELYREIEEKFGKSYYTRVDRATTSEQKSAFKNLTPDRVTATELAGDAITAKLINAPGNGASIGGLKVVSAGGWFAARPSGTENIYKIYAESFKSEEHLQEILSEASRMVDTALTV